MGLRKNLYLFHRWLGLVVSLQLLAWSVGGFVFSILDIDDVHGDFERAKRISSAVSLDRVRLTPVEAVARAADSGIAASDVAKITLRSGRAGTRYGLWDGDDRPLATVDSDTGRVVRRISADEAGAAALADFVPEATIRSVTYLDGEPPSEYRGKPMPVYQVILEHEKEPHLYVSPVTGEVVTRRNAPWRLFDFFWMLHIMDYEGRDDFNHWLLTSASVLAILTSASGLVLWVFRRRSWRRRRTFAQ